MKANKYDPWNIETGKVTSYFTRVLVYKTKCLCNNCDRYQPRRKSSYSGVPIHLKRKQMAEGRRETESQSRMLYLLP